MADATFHSLHTEAPRGRDAFVAVAVSLTLAAMLVFAARGIVPDTTQPQWHGNAGTGLVVETKTQTE